MSISANPNKITAQVNVFETQQTKTGKLYHKGSMGFKQQDGSFSNVSVSIFTSDTSLDYANNPKLNLKDQKVTVTGGFKIGTYESRDGSTKVSLTVFADEIYSDGYFRSDNANELSKKVHKLKSDIADADSFFGTATRDKMLFTEDDVPF